MVPCMLYVWGDEVFFLIVSARLKGKLMKKKRRRQKNLRRLIFGQTLYFCNHRIPQIALEVVGPYKW